MKTKDKIIEVSIDLFSNDGYNGVSIRDITKVVGIQQSSLYKHFKGKEELLEPIFAIFLEANSQSHLSKAELNEILKERDLKEFLKSAIGSFFEDLENPRLEKIFRILMNEQFRLQQARNLIIDELITTPIEFYTHVFEIKLSDNNDNHALLAREYYYPIYTMAYEYVLRKHDKQNVSSMKNQMLEHIEFFHDNVLIPKI